MKSSSKYLLMILVFALALRLIFFSGADHSDSLLYYTYSDQAAKGEFKPELNHFSSRIGIIYPQALVYRIFGVNEAASNILPLIFSISGIILTFHLGKLLFNEKTGLIAAFLLSFFPLDVIFSTRLLPDFPSAFFMALCVFLFLRAEKENSRKYYFLSGLSLGISYLMKEIAVLMALFFAAYVVYKKRFKKEYFLVALGFLLFVLVELLHAYSITGSPFYRHTQIESEEVAYLLETYSNYFTPAGMLSRLFLHWPFFMLHDIHYGIFFVFIFIAAYYSILNRKESTNILLIWIIVLMLYLNFGTLSIRDYIPIPITAKFLSIIMFPSILLLANFLSKDDRIVKKVFMPSALLVLLLSSIGFVYMSDERLIIKEIKQSFPFVEKQSKEIYTDERTKMVYDYLFGFDGNNVNAFNRFDLYSGSEKNELVDLRDKHDVFVVINNAMIKGLPLVYKDIRFPEQAVNIPKSWQPIEQFGSGNRQVVIYYVP